jgi:hypothetical protein
MLVRTILDNTPRKELSLRGRIVCALIGTAFVELLFWKTRFFHGWSDAVGYGLAAVVSAIGIFLLSKTIGTIPLILQKLPDSGDVSPGLQLGRTTANAGEEAPTARKIMGHHAGTG